MTKFGDNYFGPAQAKILGGQGTGALASPIANSYWFIIIKFW